MKKAKISSGENCDFISRLPNPILHRILGLLRIKEAVQTCVLSKRWERLWTSLPSINFRYLNFFDECGEKLMSIQRFVNFVNAFLVRRKPLDLEVFHLFCYELGSNSAVRDWILYAVNHNTRVLHLSSCGIMPWSIYTCTSVEELFLEKLHIDLSIQIVNLPKLKKLTIFYADLNSNYVKNFLSGCPMLEIIRLHSCNFTDCIIVHECLKHLHLVACHIKELFVTAPNLHTFSYASQLSLPCKTTLNMPSLSFAYLMSCDPSMIKCLEGMTTCLRFLTNVEYLGLHLEFHRNKELSTSVLSLELPIFPNLKNVTVAFCVFSSFQMATSILRSSPNLEKLTILQKKIVSPCEEEASTDESTDISSTIAFPPHKKLKIVEVKFCKYNQMVRRLVDTLMDATMEFENLNIHLSKYKCSRQYWS